MSRRYLTLTTVLLASLLAALPAAARQGTPPQSFTSPALKSQLVDTLRVDAID